MFLDDTVRLLKGTAPPFVSPAALRRKDPSDDEDESELVTEDSLDDTTNDTTDDDVWAVLLTCPKSQLKTDRLSAISHGRQSSQHQLCIEE